jgi:hypothetical protein
MMCASGNVSAIVRMRGGTTKVARGGVFPIVSANWRFKFGMGAGALAGNACPVEEEDAVGGMVVS